MKGGAKICPTRRPSSPKVKGEGGRQQPKAPTKATGCRKDVKSMSKTLRFYERKFENFGLPLKKIAKSVF